MYLELNATNDVIVLSTPYTSVILDIIIPSFVILDKDGMKLSDPRKPRIEGKEASWRAIHWLAYFYLGVLNAADHDVDPHAPSSISAISTKYITH